MISDLAVGVLVIGALGALGWIWAACWLECASPLERIGLAFPLGSGVYTLILFLLSWAQVPLGRITVTLAYLALLVPSTHLSLRKLRSNGKQWPGDPEFPGSRSTVGLVALAGLFVLAGMATLLSVARAHGNWDTAAMWVVKGYGIAKEGTIFAAATWGAHGLSYPLHIHLLVATIRLLSSDALPATKLLFPAFSISLLLGSIGFLVRSGVKRELAVLGGLFIFSVPSVFSQSTLGFANLSMGAYVTLGLLWGIVAFQRERLPEAVLGGILLGLASWTIVEGFLYVMSTAVMVVLGLALTRRSVKSEATPWKYVAAWLVSAACVSLIWLTFYRLYGAQGSQAIGTADAMFASWRAGDFNLVEARLILGYLRRYLWRPTEWGFLFTFGALIFVLDLNRLMRARPRTEWMGYLVALGTGLMTCGLFYLRSYVGSDLYAWLQRGFPRGFMPAAWVFGVTILVSAGSLARRSDLVRISSPQDE